jgi:hypothetical protein
LKCIAERRDGNSALLAGLFPARGEFLLACHMLEVAVAASETIGEILQEKRNVAKL